MARAATHFPSHIEDIQITCALRFDGWAYIERIGDEERFPRLIDEFVKKLQLFPNELDNFATFFALQRYLFKWGGEHLTKYSPEHLAFDFLFLALYTLPTPEAFIYSEYESRWLRYDRSEIEVVAAYARRSFRRRGRGPQLSEPLIPIENGEQAD